MAYTGYIMCLVCSDNCITVGCHESPMLATVVLLSSLTCSDFAQNTPLLTQPTAAAAGAHMVIADQQFVLLALLLQRRP